MLSIDPDTIVSADAASRQLGQRPAGASGASGRPQRGQDISLTSAPSRRLHRTGLRPPHDKRARKRTGQACIRGEDHRADTAREGEAFAVEAGEGADDRSPNGNDGNHKQPIAGCYARSHESSPPVASAFRRPVLAAGELWWEGYERSARSRYFRSSPSSAASDAVSAMAGRNSARKALRSRCTATLPAPSVVPSRWAAAA